MNSIAPSPSRTPADSLRLRQRANEIKRAWAEGGSPNTIAVLTSEPDLLADKSLVLDLAYEEYCLRTQAGEILDPEVFCDRFPAQRSSLRRLLAAHEYFDRFDDLPPPPEWPE